MPYNNISRFFGDYTSVQRGRLKAYFDAFKKWAADSPQPLSENGMHFVWKGMYDCRVDYAPFFFRELMRAYSEALQHADNAELLDALETNVRIIRYMTQFGVSGAYLDSETPLREKLEFLDQFAAATLKSIDAHRPTDSRVSSLRRLDGSEKPMVGLFLGMLGEVCDHAYVGDQTIGFPAFSLETTSDSTTYILRQDFDVNLGSRRFSDIGRVTAITGYPKDMYDVRTDLNDVHLFQHRKKDDGQWISGVPHSSDLLSAAVFTGGRQLTPVEMRQTARRVAAVKKGITEWFSLKPEDFNVEYCSMQSRAIKNLRQLRGQEWDVTDDAKAVINGNEIVQWLKRDWGKTYSIEVANELYDKAFEWVAEASK